jgi:hypothetical protein
MTKVPRQILAAYAFFEQFKKEPLPPQDALIPFILPFIGGKASTIFSIKELSENISTLFGPEAAQPIAESIVDPLVKAGYLKRDPSIKKEIIYFYTDLCDTIPVEASISTAERDLDAIMTVLKDYVSTISFLTPLVMDETALRAKFVDWATVLDVNEITDAVKSRRANVEDSNQAQDQLGLLFSSFVGWASRENDEIFDKIVRFSEIGLVVDLLSELRVPTRPMKKVNLTVVLDTRILLELIGLYGKPSQNSIRRLVVLCKKYGVSIVTLTHLVDEVREITYNAINNPEPAPLGSVNEAMRMHKEVKELVKTVHAAPDTPIRKEGVIIFPYSQIHDHSGEQHFTSKDIEKFADALPYDKSKPNMARRDAQSLAYAVRRQNGAHTSNLYESRCVILTRTARFVNAARSYLREQCNVPSYALVPVMELRHFSTIFMLSYGIDVVRPIVRTELIAVCDRVTRVSPDLILRLRSSMSKWDNIPKEQIAAALEDPVLLAELAVSTANEPSVVTETSGKAIFEMFRSAGARDAEMRHLEAERKLKREHEREIASAIYQAEQKQKEIDELKMRVFEQSEQVKKINSAIEIKTDSDANFIVDQIFGRVKWYWRMIVVAIGAVCLTLMIDTIFHITDPSSFTNRSLAWSIGAKVVAVILGVVVAYHTFIMVAPRFAPESLRKILVNRAMEGRLSRYSDSELREKVRTKMSQHLDDW